MDKKLTIILAIIVLVFIALGFVFGNHQWVGNVIKGFADEEESNKYSFTKAICDETNYCQDYKIECDGNKTITSKPITGAAVQQLDDWQDPRTQEQINKECE